MSDELTSFLKVALADLGRMPSTSPHIPAARLIWLSREPAQRITFEDLVLRLQSLPPPVQGWWQTSDRLAVAGTSSQGTVAWPDSDEFPLLTEGEWSAGPITLQVHRMGGQLRFTCLTEHAVPTDGALPTLAQTHEMVPRADIASQLQVTTYAAWSTEQAQIAPLAQRLTTLAANRSEKS